MNTWRGEDAKNRDPASEAHRRCGWSTRVCGGVHNVLPFVSIDANRYSVPPSALGHMVEIRRKVNGVTVKIRLAGRLIATHRLVAGKACRRVEPRASCCCGSARSRLAQRPT